MNAPSRNGTPATLLPDPGPIAQRVLDAARDLFYEQSVQGASMRDIAARANVSLSTLYSYFANKEALITEVQRRAAVIHREAIDRVFQEGREPDFALLCSAFRMHVLLQLSVAKEAAISSGATGGVGYKHVREEVRFMASTYEERFQAVARQLAERGEIASANLRIKVRMLLTAGDQVRNWFRPDGNLSADEVADIFVDLCRASLRY
jgi:AcrR family transcriptional regulator